LLISSTSGFDPAYLVTGDEPLLVQEACDQIRAAALKQGYEERTVFQTDNQFDWNRVTEETQSLSLFSTLKRVEVRLHSGKPGKGREAFERYLASPPEDVILLVSGPRLDSGEVRKSWYKQVAAAEGGSCAGMARGPRRFPALA